MTSRVSTAGGHQHPWAMRGVDRRRVIRLAHDMDPNDFPDDFKPVTPEDERHEILLRFFASQIGGVDPATLLTARGHILTLPDTPARRPLTKVIEEQLALWETGAGER